MQAVQKPKVFIDPGHGGLDPGASGNDMKECNIVLEVSQLLAEILQKGGIDTRLSRTGDIAPTAEQRWQAANTWKADIFLSIHVNAFNLPAANGTEVFFYNNPQQAQRTSDARRLAEILLLLFTERFGTTGRGIKLDTQSQHSSGLGMLRNTTMPAVLFELAFITAGAEYNDADILRNKKREMAQALADGIYRYFGMNPNDIPQPTLPLPGHVPAEWARAAWIWAMENGITDGTRPLDGITRQETMQLLYNFYNKFLAKT